MPETADVVVVGLGAMGGQTLWRLAQRGVDVLGVEQFEPGHDQGSSHGESRIIRTAYFEGADYVPLVQRSWQAWAELERATGTELVLRTGALMIGARESSAVSGAISSAQQHGLAHTVLDASDVTERYGRHIMRLDEVAVHEEDAGVIRPEAGVRAAVSAARDAGARVRTGAAVTRIDPDPQRPRVWLGDTEIAARHVVVTAGAWLPRLVPALAEHLRVERRVAAWFDVDDPVDFAPERFPLFVRDDLDGSTWYGMPALDGATVKMGLHSDARSGKGAQWGEPANPQRGVRPADGSDAARLARLAAQVRGMAAEPVRMSACMYTMTPDEHFLVGRHPELAGLTLAGGFSGHGYKFAAAMGIAVADLAQSGTTALPIAMFDPQRWN